MNKKHLLIVVIALLMSASVAHAQVSLQVRGSGAQFSRADLTELLDRFEQASRSSEYSSDERDAARASADRIRQRLERGDFRLGDRIALTVRNEPDLPDTVAVQSGPLITLPLFGEIDLYGVLRSELEGHLTRELATMINDPVVEATALTRLSVQGEVAAPGFYLVPSDMLLSEALMVAGGPTPSALVDQLSIQRTNQELLEQDEVQLALAEGLTLDQLSLQAGDELLLPRRAERGWLDTIGRVTVIVVPVVALMLQFR